MNDSTSTTPLAANKPRQSPPPSDSGLTGSTLLSQRVHSLKLPVAKEPGRASLRWVVWLVVLAAIAGGSWFAYQAYLKNAGTAPAITADTNSSNISSGKSNSAISGSASPRGAPAASTDILIERKGNVRPFRQILVSPEVNGRITRLPYEEGQFVKVGTELAVIDDTIYKAELDNAKAAVASLQQKLDELTNGNRPEEITQSERELDESKASLSQLRAEYQRNLELHRRQVLPQQTFEDSEAKYLVMQRRVEKLQAATQLMKLGPRIERINAAKADLDKAKADLVKAQWRYDNCVIYAPISGTILKKNAEVGNLVNPIAMQGSFSLCEMADLTDLEIELEIQERDVAQVFEGQKCKIVPEAYVDRKYDGYVSRIMPIANRAKGALPVRVRVIVPEAESGKYLLPEMAAQVTFYKDAAPNNWKVRKPTQIPVTIPRRAKETDAPAGLTPEPTTSTVQPAPGVAPVTDRFQLQPPDRFSPAK